MRVMIGAAIGIGVGIAATSALGVAQSRVRTTSTASAATAVVTPIAWQPMPVPVPATLGIGERIVVKDRNFASGIETDPHGSYFILERMSGSAWGRRGISLTCINAPGSCPLGTFKRSNGSCCFCTVGGTLYPYAAGADVRALIDMSNGANQSEIFTIQEIGTLAAPAGSAPGLLQGYLQQGQSLALINNRTLTSITQGWAAKYYTLMAGGQEVARWPAGLARLLTDESLRLAILTSLGRHRADNWGIPKGQLMK